MDMIAKDRRVSVKEKKNKFLLELHIADLWKIYNCFWERSYDPPNTYEGTTGSHCAMPMMELVWGWNISKEKKYHRDGKEEEKAQQNKTGSLDSAGLNSSWTNYINQ